MGTMTHEAPAMSLADMPTTDEGTVDFRRLAIRLVGQRLNAAMEMTAEGLGGRAPERLPRMLDPFHRCWQDHRASWPVGVGIIEPTLYPDSG